MKITLNTKTILDVIIGIALIGGLVWLTSLHEARAAAELQIVSAQSSISSQAAP